MLVEPVQLEWGPETWDAWRPDEISSLLAGVDARWCVVGGWALALFRGRQTRAHEDLEIATPLWDFDVLRERLSAYEFFVAGREGFWPVDGAGGAYFEYQQTMVRDPANGKWRVDVMRCPDDGTNWICALDRAIRMPYDESVAHTSDGIPYLRPELVLLYKGLQTRPKDQLDFEATTPLLDAAARRWLAEALRETKGSTHPWIKSLN
jgi:aminoglycoside-2''-adenylyltransferase